MTSATLRHVTLNSGHVARTKHGDVAAHVYAVVGPLLAHTDGRHQDLPAPFQRWRINATSHGDALMATLWHKPTGAPVLSFGVAGDAVSAADVWPQLEAHAQQMGTPIHATRPATPWIAVVLLPSAGAVPEQDLRGAMGWAGDFERCVAWSWLMRRGLVDVTAG